jgi:hypothetical protein
VKGDRPDPSAAVPPALRLRNVSDAALDALRAAPTHRLTRHLLALKHQSMPSMGRRSLWTRSQETSQMQG